ncbi:barstar family protein [Actinacidiphila guanduensis]|uniref:Barstar (Barnase inhibitor) n=1 Tax=Actinacidiphila guanduensis TaxID=310781 RepID=A0A1H0Q0D6_9ACTN|nr:barstar family protein [Actinacidiphila guanduensis]SDP10774.1 Barstar (barnase inhibitor) [Actinacidiphila guanduensis]
MRIAEHAAWDRGFPVTYLLVREDEEGEEKYWGRCAGVEGMFVDKVPPKREVLTLRGCTPAGSLLDALSPSAESTGLLGDVCVEVWDEQQPLQWWTLVDAVVLAHQPHRTDPALVDVVVGAGVEEVHAWDHTLPVSPQFRLFTASTMAASPAGHCAGVDGLFVSRRVPPSPPLHLIGCEAAESLLSVLRRPGRWDRDWVQLWALDRHGEVMYRHNFPLRIEKTRPSVLGGALIDITLADGGDDRPSLSARPIWETWYRGVPRARNTWAPYSAQGRSEWLELTANHMSGQRPDRSGGVHHLDGTFVTDVPGLHCAMAEALVGPGGYFGREWNAFKDCLSGGFGVLPPFTLIWHDADVARQALADVVSDPAEGLSYFEDIVRLLTRYGAVVELQ